MSFIRKEVEYHYFTGDTSDGAISGWSTSFGNRKIYSSLTEAQTLVNPSGISTNPDAIFLRAEARTGHLGFATDHYQPE